jgi:hypothetical protein
MHATIHTQTPAAAQPLWMRIEPYRACDLCMHVQPGQEERHCGHHSARCTGGQLPVRAARAYGAPCGPNADHMAAGWQA